MIVAAVARSWHVRAQQGFTWRRELRRAAAPGFAPIVAEPSEHNGQAPLAASIEVGIGGAVLRVSLKTDPTLLTMVGACAADRSWVITLPAGARILLASRPVDFRKGAHAYAPWRPRRLARIHFLGWSWCSGPSGRTGSRSSCGMAVAWCWSSSSRRAAAFCTLGRSAHVQLSHPGRQCARSRLVGKKASSCSGIFSLACWQERMYLLKHARS